MHRVLFQLHLGVLMLAAAVGIPYPAEGSPGVLAAREYKLEPPSEPVALKVSARHSLQDSDTAFPSDSAGFSAYFRMERNGAYRLDKGKVDDHIFSPVEPEDSTLRTAPATLVEVGENYTVATLTLENIDLSLSKVNLYYDDEGWIVAYLSSGEASALVWQAKDIDVENPSVDEIGGTILLESINIVVDEALEEDPIEADDAELGYYHWQYPDADNFLMMAVSRRDQGEYPVQFAIPDSLTISEISASLWVSQGSNSQAPCAHVTLDDADLIARQCSRGIYSATADLSSLSDTIAHTWKLIHSERDQGGSGALLMIIYQSTS